MTSVQGRVIDLRLFRPRERLGIVEQSLAVLSAGEDVLLVFHEPPQRLLDHLAARYADRLAMTFVDEGPDVWSIRVEACGNADGSVQGGQ